MKTLNLFFAHSDIVLCWRRSWRHDWSQWEHPAFVGWLGRFTISCPKQKWLPTAFIVVWKVWGHRQPQVMNVFISQNFTVWTEDTLHLCTDSLGSHLSVMTKHTGSPFLECHRRDGCTHDKSTYLQRINNDAGGSDGTGRPVHWTCASPLTR